jgi:hypothetical protein
LRMRNFEPIFVNTEKKESEDSVYFKIIPVGFIRNYCSCFALSYIGIDEDLASCLVVMLSMFILNSSIVQEIASSQALPCLIINSSSMYYQRKQVTCPLQMNFRN